MPGGTTPSCVAHDRRSELIDLLILWIGLLVALLGLAIGPPGRGGALTLAYFLALSLIHVPGVLAFLGTDPALSEFADTRVGFEVTLAGMAAFLGGAVAARMLDRTPPDIARQSPEPGFDRAGWRALAIGAGSYLLLSFVFGRLASATSIVSSLPNLVILGFWMLSVSRRFTRRHTPPAPRSRTSPAAAADVARRRGISRPRHSLGSRHSCLLLRRGAPSLVDLPGLAVAGLPRAFAVRDLYGPARGNPGCRLVRAGERLGSR